MRGGNLDSTAATSGEEHPAPSRRLVGLTWLALAVAFSPVVIDRVQHWALRPWARYAPLFAVLFAVAVGRAPRMQPRRTGYVLVLLGLLLEVVAVGGGVVRLGRAGLGLALVGGCRALGLASLPASLLGLWIIPLPHRLATLASPQLEGLWLRAVAAPLGAPGLALEPTDGGLALVPLLAGLGWYAAVRRGGGLGQAVRTAARWAPFGLLAQGLSVAAAALLMAAQVGEVAPRAALDHSWVPAAAVGLLVAHRSLGGSSGTGSREGAP